MTALLTDEQAAIAAARKYAVSLDQPATDEYHIRVDGFLVGARFARSTYEARLAEAEECNIRQRQHHLSRLAEDAKVRAGLVEALELALSYTESHLLKAYERDELEKMQAALAAARERG